MTVLEFRRRKLGMSQTRLAQEIGYKAHGSIYLLERCRPHPDGVSRRLRRAIESYFNMPLKQLLSDVDEINVGV